MKYGVVLFLLVALTVASHAQEAVKQDMQYIQVKKAIVRSKASLLGKQIKELGYGVKVNVLEVKGRWSKIQLGELTGWIRSTRLSKNEIKFDATASDANTKLSGDESQTAASGLESGLDKQGEMAYRKKNKGIDKAYKELDALEQNEDYEPEPAKVDKFAKEGKLKEVAGE